MSTLGKNIKHILIAYLPTGSKVVYIVGDVVFSAVVSSTDVVSAHSIVVVSATDVVSAFSKVVVSSSVVISVFSIVVVSSPVVVSAFSIVVVS